MILSIMELMRTARPGNSFTFPVKEPKLHEDKYLYHFEGQKEDFQDLQLEIDKLKKNQNFFLLHMKINITASDGEMPKNFKDIVSDIVHLNEVAKEDARKIRKYKKTVFEMKGKSMLKSNTLKKAKILKSPR